MKKWLISIFLLMIIFIAAFVVGINMRFPIRYMNIIEQNAGELDPSWILAVIMAESSFRPNAQSHAGAQGLMQLMPTTAEWVAQLMSMEDFEPDMIWSPEVNITLGSFYLNRLLRLYNGNITLALAAYNAGQGNVNNWLLNPEVSSDGETLDVIPFNETYNYLRRVNFNQRVYEIRLSFNKFFGVGGNR